MQSAYLRETSSGWFHGTLLKAGDKQTNILNLATALHRDALAMQLDRTPGWLSAKFRAIERWPDNMELWAEWERIYTDVSRPDAGRAAWNFYQKNRRGARSRRGTPLARQGGSLHADENAQSRKGTPPSSAKSRVRPSIPRGANGRRSILASTSGSATGPPICSSRRSPSTRAKVATRGTATTRHWSCWGSTAGACCMSRPISPGGRLRRS